VQGFSGGASFNVGGNRSNGTASRSTAAPSKNSNAQRQTIPSHGLVQAVRIVTSNYQAESGVNPARESWAVTKGGTKAFHGAATVLPARVMNANQFSITAGRVADPPPCANAGFNIGGPVYIPANSIRAKTGCSLRLAESHPRRAAPGYPHLTVPTDADPGRFQPQRRFQRRASGQD